MEPAVRQYDFTSPPVSISWLKKVGLVFAVGCSMFILRWAWDKFFHWTDESLLRSLVTSAIFGAVWVVYQFSYWLPQRLIIGPNFVEARTRAGSLPFKKRIEREQSSRFQKTGEESVSRIVAKLRPEFWVDLHPGEHARV